MFTKKLALVAAAVVLGIGLAAPVAAASDSSTYPKGVDYRGTFGSTVTFVGFTDEGTTSPYCIDATGEHVTPPVDQHLTGTWRANVGAKIVSARFAMYINDVPHVVYTAPMVREVTDATFQAGILTGAGQLTITLVGTDFSYTIQPYDTTPFWADGLACESATFHGTLS